MQHSATAPDMPCDVDKNLEAEEKPQEEEKPEAEGEETDDDDEREPMYDNTDYDHVRFDPIWYGDYPGDEMPPEIAVELGENLEFARYHQMVGSSRTIFHMCGRPDVLSQSGASLSLFFSHVSKKKASFPGTMYPGCRVVHGETIKVVRVQDNRNFHKFEKDVIAHFTDGLLQRKDTLFRGPSLFALEQPLAFFLPVISSTNADNEFGPGIYTTESLLTAKKYAGRTGAIVVFSTPDERSLKCWEPTGDEWRRLTAKWIGLSLSDIGVPPDYQTADVIKGVMSADQSKAQRQNRFLNPDDVKQTAFVSYRGCESLRRELKAIIFIKWSK
ncbi:hypothetical protein P875_00095573 [Aspergillus parasiticus SU-1]|uniref:Uncharacterized protein n=1 Tax=Aspergillus parasiticus (strain ATCC 56775 / NRRL 5862 / SRRC 143 / SU-1) TaxID=1403190 RepID=A0A0F0I6L5_ASPPU|nr:hypothetical protein P875_00095573 [Aspergillus parasiticus SU-1]